MHLRFKVSKNGAFWQSTVNGGNISYGRGGWNSVDANGDRSDTDTSRDAIETATRPPVEPSPEPVPVPVPAPEGSPRR